MAPAHFRFTVEIFRIMIFTETLLKGAFLIDLEKRGDDRGFFARAFCENEFASHQLSNRFVQVNNSLSAQCGTLRGMHYQLSPKAETKLVRCIRGGTQAELRLKLPNGKYHAEWLNTRTGKPDKSEDIDGAAEVQLSSPAHSEDIALRIKSSG